MINTGKRLVHPDFGLALWKQKSIKMKNIMSYMNQKSLFNKCGQDVCGGISSDKTISNTQNCQVKKLIQTGGAINPGNSGGPLLPIEGF